MSYINTPTITPQIKVLDTLDPDLWWYSYEFLDGPMLVMADGTLVGVHNQLFAEDKPSLVWVDRLDLSVHSIGRKFPETRVITLAADVDKKRILYLDANSCELRQVTGLPAVWFAPKSHLHNWRRLAFLLAFVRANRLHPFANSGLHLLSSILYFLQSKNN